MTARAKRATLVTIARECGVSRQTVSNVINSPERVAPATRELVEEAIRRANYRPSEAARSLRRQRTQVIGLRMSEAGDGINGAVLDRFLHALVLAARDRDHRVLLFAADDPEEETDVIQDLVTRGVIDGCILTDTTGDDERPTVLRAAGIPFVAFGRPWERALDEHRWVDIDGAAATQEATEWLTGLGVSPIAFLGWPDAPGVGRDRRAGWLRALPEGSPRLEVACVDSMAAGRLAMARLLNSGAQGVVCASDSLALGAYLAWRDAGPDAGSGPVPVVGFDDTPLAAFRGFSSAAQPTEQAAAACMRLLVDQLEHPEVVPEHVLLPASLRLRFRSGTEGITNQEEIR